MSAVLETSNLDKRFGGIVGSRLAARAGTEVAERSWLDERHWVQ